MSPRPEQDFVDRWRYGVKGKGSTDFELATVVPYQGETAAHRARLARRTQ